MYILMINNQKKKDVQDNHQVRQDFEKNWAQQNEFDVMRQSELLDSLNLEVSHVKKKKPQKEPR